MLTKWGSALGLASAGRIVSMGGGNTPLGTATVWPSQLIWTDLNTLPAPDLRSGDRALVLNLGTTGSSGIAQYNGSDWELVQAVFATFSDLQLFGSGGQLIAGSAIASIGTGIGTDLFYFYNGSQWLRTPDGIHYIWQQRADWLALSTIIDPKNNDRVSLNTLGTAHSSGIAERQGGQWRLVQGRFNSVADMVNWTATPGQVVHAGAFAEVKSGGGHDDDSVTYIYQSGNWVRFAGLTAGYAWALSSMQDFSAIGLQDGDFGIFTPSGGFPITLRYKAVTPRAPGAGSGNIQAWLPQEVYAGNPTLQAYLVGTESAGTLGGQGFTVFTSGAGGSVSSVGGFVRCTDGNVASSSASLGVTALSGTITSTTKLYVRFRCRAPAIAGTPFALNLRDGTSVITWAAGSTLYVGGSGTPPASVGASFLRNSGTALPTTSGSDWLEFLAEGTAVMNRMVRNGAEYAAVRTSVGALTATSAIFFGDLSGATTNSTIEFADMQVFTW